MLQFTALADPSHKTGQQDSPNLTYKHDRAYNEAE